VVFLGAASANAYGVSRSAPAALSGGENFAWIGRHRRTSKNYEHLTSRSENCQYHFEIPQKCHEKKSPGREFYVGTFERQFKIPQNACCLKHSSFLILYTEAPGKVPGLHFVLIGY